MRGRGGRKDRLSRFPVAKLFSHMTEKLRKGIFQCLEKLLRSRNVRDKRGVSAISVRIVLSHSIEKYRKGWIPEFRNFRVSKKFMDIRGWTIITTSRQKRLSHRTEGFRRGTLLCLRNFLVSRNVTDKRGVSRFSVEIVFVTAPKIFVKDFFFFSGNFWYRGMLEIRDGVSRFSVKIV